MIWHNFGAAKVVTFTFGVFSGWLGLEHGYFETLQGGLDQSGLITRPMA
jgi:hypothetical protein